MPASTSSSPHSRFVHRHCQPGWQKALSECRCAELVAVADVHGGVHRLACQLPEAAALGFAPRNHTCNGAEQSSTQRTRSALWLSGNDAAADRDAGGGGAPRGGRPGGELRRRRHLRQCRQPDDRARHRPPLHVQQPPAPTGAAPAGREVCKCVLLALEFFQYFLSDLPFRLTFQHSPCVELIRGCFLRPRTRRLRGRCALLSCRAWPALGPGLPAAGQRGHTASHAGWPCLITQGGTLQEQNVCGPLTLAPTHVGAQVVAVHARPRQVAPLDLTVLHGRRV